MSSGAVIYESENLFTSKHRTIGLRRGVNGVSIFEEILWRIHALLMRFATSYIRSCHAKKISAEKHRNKLAIAMRNRRAIVCAIHLPRPVMATPK